MSLVEGMCRSFACKDVVEDIEDKYWSVPRQSSISLVSKELGISYSKLHDMIESGLLEVTSGHQLEPVDVKCLLGYYTPHPKSLLLGPKA